MNRDNISILAISDDGGILSLIEEFVSGVENSGLSFSTSENNAECVGQIISKEKVDLVVFDIDNLDNNSFNTIKYLLKNNISHVFLKREKMKK